MSGRDPNEPGPRTTTFLADWPSTEGAAVSPEERYRELGELGRGGFGRVTLRFDELLRRRVAAKETRRHNERDRRMLLHEARLLAYLDHPGVVPVFDTEEGDRTTAYTMKLLSGETLLARLQREGALSVAEAVRVVTRVAETMANAHDKGVLHLDLKPANIMMQPYGQVCVIDWGMARLHDPTTYADVLGRSDVVLEAELLSAMGVGGTPAYMAPEQTRQGAVLTPAADVFALGTVLYELLTGDLPFAIGDTLEAVARAKTATELRPLVELRGDVPAQLDVLCRRMLAPAPADRPGDFHEVLDALAALSGATSIGEVRELADGEVLFREGEVGREAFHILSGALVVTIDAPDGTRVLATRAVGEVIGEMAIVSSAPRSATVAAAGPTRVRVITATEIEEELRNAHPLLTQLIRGLSDRLREQTELVRGEPPAPPAGE